jgi:class 3 adenylate cyclase
MDWSEQATTASDVIALQKFRDLFSGEVLRKGQEISVGSLAVVFTDLKSSTKLYREIGDAPAFGLVMNHFNILKASIATHGGALIKTIGDAVMAVFSRPIDAIHAMLEAGKILENPPDGTRPLKLKAGIHYGHCIAVTLNDKLDYFGSTVNLAARLEQFSSGGDVILSESVLQDPEAKLFVDSHKSSHALDLLETALKGFDAEQFRLWRLISLDIPSSAQVKS